MDSSTPFTHPSDDYNLPCAMNDTPSLLKEIERLQARVAELEWRNERMTQFYREGVPWCQYEALEVNDE